MTEDAFPITIYHNPNCGTSRNALAIIRAAGYEPEVVEYLTAGWTTTLLITLLDGMGISARDLMREKGTPAADLGLLLPDVSPEEIVAAMVERAKKGSCVHAKTLLEMTGAKHMFDGEGDGQESGEPWAKLVLERLDEAESRGEPESASKPEEVQEVAAAE